VSGNQLVIAVTPRIHRRAQITNVFQVDVTGIGTVELLNHGVSFRATAPVEPFGCMVIRLIGMATPLQPEAL
jgi:hypothetical protein